MQSAKFTYWEDEGMFIGYFVESPDYWTQATSLTDLEEHLRDLYDGLELIPEPSPSGRGQGEGKHDVGTAARVLAIHEYWDKLLTSGNIPGIRRVAELVIS